MSDKEYATMSHHARNTYAQFNMETYCETLLDYFGKTNLYDM
jgi:hypothetical protein